jgi:hypothetical protein
MGVSVSTGIVPVVPAGYKHSAADIDPPGVNTDMFGGTVAISADGLVAAVGELEAHWGPHYAAGRVLTYDRADIESDWVLREEVYPTGPFSDNNAGVWDFLRFGSSVTLNEDGTKLSIGAGGYGWSFSYRGCVLTYTWSGSAWGSEVIAYATVPLDDRAFGDVMAMSADGLVLAVGDDDIGIDGGVIMFDWVGGVWVDRLEDFEPAAGTIFNYVASKSVALNYDGSRLLTEGDDNFGNFTIGFEIVLLVDWNGSAWVNETMIHLKSYDPPDVLWGDDEEIYNISCMNAAGTKYFLGADGFDAYFLEYIDSSWVVSAPYYDNIYAPVNPTKFEVNWYPGDQSSMSYNEILLHGNYYLEGTTDSDNVAVATVSWVDSPPNSCLTTGFDWNKTPTAQVGVPDPPNDEVGWGWKVALSGDGLVMCVADTNYEVATDVIGRIHTYDLVGGAWVHRASYIDYTRVITSKGSVGFGHTMFLNGDGSVVAVAANGEPITDVSPGHWNGAVYVYTSGGGAWTLREKVYPAEVDILDDSLFGDSIAIDTTGDILVVGCPWITYDGFIESGRVYTYDWSGSSYVARSNLEPGIPAEDEQFGRAVALSPDGEMLVLKSDTKIETYDHAGGLWLKRTEVGSYPTLPLYVANPISEDKTTLLAGKFDFQDPYTTGYMTAFSWRAGQGWVEVVGSKFIQSAAPQLGSSRWGTPIAASHDLSTIVTTGEAVGGSTYEVWLYGGTITEIYDPACGFCVTRTAETGIIGEKCVGYYVPTAPTPQPSLPVPPQPTPDGNNPTNPNPPACDSRLSALISAIAATDDPEYTSYLYNEYWGIYYACL